VFTKLKNGLKNWGRKRALILMYHQICTRVTDPWQLAVSPECFEAQLNYVTKNFDIVPLEKLTNCLNTGKLSSKMLSITFDDGFTDNYINARPILESYKVPATFYITTNAMESGRLYWWDELELLILQTAQLPKTLQLKAGAETFKFSFTTDHILDAPVVGQIREWNAGMMPSNERLSLFLSLWKSIQPLPFQLQQEVLAELRSWAGVDHVDKSHTVMTRDQLVKLSRNSLFSVGAHTVNHSLLAAHDVHVQAFEVQESKRTLEGLLGREITGFSYPYGNYNDITRILLRNAGFQSAVSTENRMLNSTEDLFALPRVQVKNTYEKEFANHLQQLVHYEN